MIKDADETALKNDQSVLSEVLLGIKVTSLLFGLTSNALSNAQDIVSKKSDLGSDGLGALFNQVNTTISASEGVISTIAGIKENTSYTAQAEEAAKTAWNAVGFLVNQAKGKYNEGVIPANVNSNFKSANSPSTLAGAQSSILQIRVFYNSLLNAYTQSSFTSSGPDYPKQAYNLSIAQTTFGLLKDLVDASGEVMSDLQVNGPQAILKEYLMRSSNTSTQYAYHDLKTAILGNNQGGSGNP